MSDLIKKLNTLSLPAVILIASVILGGFFYASQLSEQKSIERQQILDIKQDCNEKYPETGFKASADYSRCISIIK